MKGGVKILIVTVCLFIAAIIVLLASIPLELPSCRKDDDNEKVVSLEAEILLSAPQAEQCLYTFSSYYAPKDVPVLNMNNEYILSIKACPPKSMYYRIHRDNINLNYNNEHLEIIPDDKTDDRFIVRGLTECRGEVIEIHHLYYGDTEFIPCNITVNFS